MKCQAKVDKGASRVKGFHNFSDCTREAKFKVTYNDNKGGEIVKYFCGCHMNSFSLKNSSLKYKYEKL